jgi:putative membrane protein
VWGRTTDPDRLFSDADLQAVREAATLAEIETSGEVVPYVVGRCDDYPETLWKAAMWSSILVTTAAGVLHLLGGYWGGFGVLWITLPAVAGAGAGALLAWCWPGLRRLLVTPSALEQRVERRAALAFLDEEVFATRDRTGILIFLALFERRVLVLADSGINAKVEQSEWDGLVGRLREGVQRGEAATALVVAIEECGRLLAERKVEPRADDANELRDHLRLSDA